MLSMSATPDRRPARFEITGGALCLDLANTVSERSTVPVDRLASYDDLLDWAEQSGTWPPATVAGLRRRAAVEPAAAAGALAAAREIREAVFRVFSALASGAPPPADDLARLDRALGPALARLGLAPGEGEGEAARWRWRAPVGLADVLAPVVRSAAELLTSGDAARVRECAADDCRWLFLDRSRNRSRRWCDMAQCGNRAKARRHYRRRQAGG
jgi:predicted RNA-binding Zn ribbon-like protein